MQITDVRIGQKLYDKRKKNAFIVRTIFDYGGIQDTDMHIHTAKDVEPHKHNPYIETHASDLLNQIKDSLDSSKQNKLLKLICPIGTTVYIPDETTERIHDITITQIHVAEVDDELCTQYEGPYFEPDGSLYDTFEFEPEDFGKTVFLNPKDAENVLETSRHHRDNPI